MTKGQLIRCYLGIYFWGVSRRWVGCVNDKCIISINYFLDKDSHAQIVMIQFHLPSAEVCSLIPFWSPHLENRKKEIAYPPLNREVTARGSKIDSFLKENGILKRSNDTNVTSKISRGVAISRSNRYLKALKIQIHLALQEWSHPWQNHWPKRGLYVKYYYLFIAGSSSQ